jgi:hypothetical protein
MQTASGEPFTALAPTANRADFDRRRVHQAPSNREMLSFDADLSHRGAESHFDRCTSLGAHSVVVRRVGHRAITVKLR